MHHSGEATASSSNPICVGELHLIEPKSNDVVAVRRVYLNHELLIGRDRAKCQWVLDDPRLSAKHLRIYTVVYDNEDEGQILHLVYAEDVSRHGTFWNGSLVGKGNGGYLLTHNDTLRLSVTTSFRFVEPRTKAIEEHFDLQQENEMVHFRNEYVVTDRLLGEGAFGRVFMAIEQRTRAQMACKLIDLRRLRHTKASYFDYSRQPLPAALVNQKDQTKAIESWAEQQRKGSQLEETLKVFYREVDILSQLSHPNIIGIDKVYITDKSIYIFQDLITAGDLFSYLESKTGRLTEIETAVIVYQILIALQFLHNHNIVHRDLKPENILMTSLAAGCRIVLTDFGSARRLRATQRTYSVVGSEQYTAPELRHREAGKGKLKFGYTKAVDMWSVGTVTVVLLTGGFAFTDPATGTYSSVLARNCNLTALESMNEWQQIRPRPKDFVTQLLVLDEQKRMTAQQALSHAWFANEIHKTELEDLYQRATKNWYPRVKKDPVIEFNRANLVKHLVLSQQPDPNKKRPNRDQTPIDPPYKPFPRNMHITLWPKRRDSGQMMSDEVRKAIAEKKSVVSRNTQSGMKPSDHSAGTVSSDVGPSALRQATIADERAEGNIWQQNLCPSSTLSTRPRLSFQSDPSTVSPPKEPNRLQTRSDLSRTSIFETSSNVETSLPRTSNPTPVPHQQRLSGLQRCQRSRDSSHPYKNIPTTAQSRNAIFDLPLREVDLFNGPAA